MPVSKRQSNSAIGTTTSLSVTLASAPIAGNIIVAIAGSNANLANQYMSAPSTGWDVSTEALAGATTNLIGVYARTVVSGESSTYTLAAGAANINFLYVAEFSGVGTLAQSVTVYDSVGVASSTDNRTTFSTPLVVPSAGVSGYALAGLWLSGGAGGAASSWTATNGFTSPPTVYLPGSNTRGATAELSIASTTGSAYSTTFGWPTARGPAAAIIVVTEVNYNVYIYAVDTIYTYENTEVRRDPLITSAIDTITVSDRVWYYDDLIYLGDNAVVVISSNSAYQFFAWFG